MAEILVMAQSRTHSDPDKDRRGSYKAGDIVAVFPDGHEWGLEERLPKFWQIAVPGLASEFRDRALPEERMLPPPSHIPDRTPILTQVRRRRWFLDITLLPPLNLIELQTLGRTSLTRTQLGAALADKTIRDPLP